MTRKKKKTGGMPLILKPKFSNKIAAKLDEAVDLIEGGKIVEASQILAPLYRDFSREPSVLRVMAVLRIHQDDPSNALPIVRKALALSPNDPEMILMMVGLEVHLGYLSLAYNDFKSLQVGRLGAVERKEYFRIQEVLQQYREFRLKDAEIEAADFDEKIRIEAINDCSVLELRAGNFRDAEKYARKVIALRPSDMPGRNNLSEILFQQNKMELSLSEACQALSIEPDNQFTIALALRAGYLHDDQETLSLSLSPVMSERHYVKQMEGLLFKGDLDTIVSWQKRIISLPQDGPFDRTVALRMLACVLIKKELVREAQEVIAVMAQEKRGTVSDVGVGMSTVFPVALSSGKGTSAHKEMVEQAMEQPWFVRATSFLIRFGDVPAISLGIGAAEALLLPEYIPALTEFAAEDRGTEELRIRASQCIDKINGVLQGKHVVFMKGAKTEVLTSKIRITREPTLTHEDPRLEGIHSEIVRLSNLGKSEEVRALFEQARELGDTSCTVRFNYAASLLGAGKKNEGLAIIRALHAEDPEYLFARVELAKQAVTEGRLEEAQDLLAPLLMRTELHFTEYRALVAGQVMLALAKGDVDAASGGVEALEKVLDEGDSVLEQLKGLVKMGERLVVGG